MKDIKKIRKIHEKLGDDTLIILINAGASIAAVNSNNDSKNSKDDRNSKIDKHDSKNSKVNSDIKIGDNNSDNDSNLNESDWISQAFTSVFHYAPPLLPSSTTNTDMNIVSTNKRELLLYHEYSSKWYLAEKINKGGILGSNIQLPSITGTTFKTVHINDNKPTQQELVNLLKI